MTTKFMMNPSDFSALDKHESVSQSGMDAYGLTTNFPINNSYFQPHEHFFASIGYIAHQIALLEDSLKQSMMHITGDFDAVDQQTKGRNLGALIKIYELVFLSKFGKDLKLKNYFYAVRALIQKANNYRNDAVHKNWGFVENDPEKPFFCLDKIDGPAGFIISPDLMRRRAIYTHTVLLYFEYIRALTEDPDGYSPDIIQDGKMKLDELVSLGGFI